MERFVEEKKLPNLLFYGPPGTGKTSTVVACAKQMYGPSLYNSMVLEVKPCLSPFENLGNLAERIWWKRNQRGQGNHKDLRQLSKHRDVCGESVKWLDLLMGIGLILLGNSWSWWFWMRLMRWPTLPSSRWGEVRLYNRGKRLNARFQSSRNTLRTQDSAWSAISSRGSSPHCNPDARDSSSSTFLSRTLPRKSSGFALRRSFYILERLI